MKFNCIMIHRLLASLTLCAACFAPTLRAAEPIKPNVVLILIDDFGYECVTANGGQSYQTPVMDQLAATGVRFEQCHVQPLCTPTRVALMTGIMNKRNYTNFGNMDESQKTFGNLMKANGYATCITGKWQLGQSFELPAHFGFDEYCLWQLTRLPGRYRNPGLELNGKVLDCKNNEYGPDIVTDYALDFMTRNKNKPFFLYYPIMLTHDPYDATPDSPNYLTSTKHPMPPNLGHFPDMVAYTDKLIGKLVAKLDELHLRDNTIVLILGDNGTGKGTPSKFKGCDVKGDKGGSTMWGTRVPLIGNWPGHFASGKINSDLIDATDILPTICAATATPVPASLNIDGRSFLPQLRGEKGKPREVIYAWYNPQGGPTAKYEFAHDGHFKLYSDGRFYHYETDELEKTPLADKSLDAAAKAAKAKLAAALKENSGPRPKAFANKRTGTGSGKKKFEVEIGEDEDGNKMPAGLGGME